MNHSYSRRQFIQASLLSVPLASCSHTLTKRFGSRNVKRNQVIEFTFHSDRHYADAYNEIALDVEFMSPSGKTKKHPAFWTGGKSWKARLAGDELGTYSFRTLCSNLNDKGLHLQLGDFTVREYNQDNPLYQHGRLHIADDRHHFIHADGTPFFWTGDTWWMGLCERIDFPKGFKSLTADRVEKGFNVIQIVVGPYPDMDSFDPRNQNEAGFPFTENYQSVNPDYFHYADRRLQHLIQAGLMPCIVGMWGYYFGKIGKEKIERYWRYLIARYGAYPVVWCLAGEGTMPFYLTQTREQDSAMQKKGWTEIGRTVQKTDAFDNLVTIHPSHYGRETVEDPSVIDFEMLQTGHSDLDSVPNTAKSAIHSAFREPKMPVINSETNYEGILGRAWQNIQRMSFYASVLNGMAGYTYGANGIWQMNQPDKPYGTSPHGRSWGSTSWQEASQLPGSRQIGIGSRFMQRFPWWKLERHPEWVEPNYDPNNAYSTIAAGIPGKLRIIYMPMAWNAAKIVKIEPDVKYNAYWFDPIHGDEIKIGKVNPNRNGEWTPPHPEVVHDWLLVIQV